MLDLIKLALCLYFTTINECWCIFKRYSCIWLSTQRRRLSLVHWVSSYCEKRLEMVEVLVSVLWLWYIEELVLGDLPRIRNIVDLCLCDDHFTMLFTRWSFTWFHSTFIIFQRLQTIKLSDGCPNYLIIDRWSDWLS